MDQPLHIVIVDDDQNLCNTLAGLLAGQGHRVDCLTTRDKPHLTIRTLAPELILLDISVQPDGGLATLNLLQNHHQTRKIPVIATSEQVELEYELLDLFDFLAKPLDTPRLLEDIALLRDPSRPSDPAPYPSLGAAELTLFQDYLITHSGLHFDERNSKILERGLMRRMRAVNARSYLDYLTYLKTIGAARQELKKLLGLLTIGETYFFRYRAHFDALVKAVLPEILQRNARERTLRIWSAGCSTGAEPYSIAILLLEHFPHLADWEVEILATDISQRALQTARAGIVGPRALRVTDDRYRNKYFQPFGAAFRIDPLVQSRVRFTYLNLQTGLYPAPETGTCDVDLIFCRNVMIYFRLATNRQIVEKLSRCLRPGGYLFLGHAETLINLSARFERIHAHGGFYYRLLPSQRGESTEPEPQPTPPARPTRRVTLPPLPAAPPPEPLPPVHEATQPQLTPSLEDLVRLATTAFDQEDFVKADQIYDRILLLEPHHSGALIGKGFVQANQGQYLQALALCDRALAVNDLLPEAYFLRGLVLEYSDDAEGAISEYRKALLLAMDFIMPRYNLSQLFRRLGRLEDSRRELHNTCRLLEQAPDEALIPFSGGLSRTVFLEICREDGAIPDQA